MSAVRSTHSVARGNESAPLCAPHRQQARAVFESAEPLLGAHLQPLYGGELDEWVRQGVLPGLSWHLQVRDNPPAHGPEEPPRPGRPVHVERDPDGVVRILRELIVRALEQQVSLAESGAVLRVGTPDRGRTAWLDPATTRTALQGLVADLVTVDRLEALLLRGLPLTPAERTVIDAAVESEREADELVGALGVLSQGAQSALAQEAHEAIRPTSIRRLPADMKRFLTADQARLYELIWKRFLASQMASAIFDVTTVEIDATRPGVPRYRYRATGSRPRFLGFLRLYREGRDDQTLRDEERQPLPSLAARDPLDLLHLAPRQHFTGPPPRYTEATLVKALEERGIGRPSTYAPTMATIQDRQYVELDGKLLRPTLLGEQVNDYLVAHFGDVVDLAFTAELEARLDEIARGQRAWVPVVSAYYQPLAVHLRDANAGATSAAAGEPSDEVCSQGHPMLIRNGRFGRFLACSRYPDPQESRPLLAPLGVACPSCGGGVVEKHTRTGSTFFGCVTYPGCTWTSSYRPLSEPCPSCGGTRVELDERRQHCLKHQGSPPRQIIDAATSGQRLRRATGRTPRTTGAQEASIRRSPATSTPVRKSDAHARRPRKPKS
jgi:ssDNA-binding Zn-finger/Zn-ribbon topoisomerase 1